jgi:ribosomal protein S18 acetylase RimI-like enzyme
MPNSGGSRVLFRTAKIEDSGAVAELIYIAAQVFSGFPPEPSGFWTVDHVAVLPDWRGRGLARGCLQATFERGKKQGFAKAKLDVFRGNRAARTLYDSCGFQLSATFDNKALRTVLKRDAIERLILTL